MGAVKVLQVVGFKNSGKTALLSRLLGIAKETGKAVSTIKHHGHGGAPEMPPESTDSQRFFEEGAKSSIVYGGGIIQLHQRKETASLDELVQLALPAGPDIILVEGFKEAGHEKIVLVRTKEDWEELKHLERIALVLVPEGLRLVGVEKAEQNIQEIENWFLEWMEDGADKSI